ncbi:MAG: redoxin domain-containing protein [Rhodospirillales bacterium]
MTRHHLAAPKTPLAACAVAAALALLPVSPAAAKPEVGKPAPAFTGMTAEGRTVNLSSLKGRTVVLEWTNKDCPYVRKHYGTQNMQALQKDAKAQYGVTWISVLSSEPGAQGHLEAAAALANVRDTNAAPDHVVLDPEGKIGRTYAATVTPHMYVIDGDGMLRFMGGIDDKPSSRHDTVAAATNYVRAALADLAAGRQVAQAVTRPYGCFIKYAD